MHTIHIDMLLLLRKPEYELTDDSWLVATLQKKKPRPREPIGLFPDALQVVRRSSSLVLGPARQGNWIAVDFRSQLQAQFYGKQSGIVPFCSRRHCKVEECPRVPRNIRLSPGENDRN